MKGREKRRERAEEELAPLTTMVQKIKYKLRKSSFTIVAILKDLFSWMKKREEGEETNASRLYSIL